jgi:hypothetical protein
VPLGVSHPGLSERYLYSVALSNRNVSGRRPSSCVKRRPLVSFTCNLTQQRFAELRWIKNKASEQTATVARYWQYLSPPRIGWGSLVLGSGYRDRSLSGELPTPGCWWR